MGAGDRFQQDLVNACCPGSFVPDDQFELDPALFYSHWDQLFQF